MGQNQRNISRQPNLKSIKDYTDSKHREVNRLKQHKELAGAKPEEGHRRDTQRSSEGKENEKNKERKYQEKGPKIKPQICNEA